MAKIKVGILGATGIVGQRFVQFLHNHPWFELTELVASPQEAGKTYREAVGNKWILEEDMPEEIAVKKIKSSEDRIDCRVLFSGLPGEIAEQLEPFYAKKGFAVVSNASAFRMDELVPLLIPEINPEHLDLIPVQKEKKGWKGFIVTNPNCTTVPVAMVLKALEKFKPRKAIVTSMQGLSGAGYPGVPSLDVIDNVMPFIEGEEEKIEEEPQKILGKFSEGKIRRKELKISAQCNRVNVKEGHLETIAIEFENKPKSREELIRALNEFKGLPQEKNLPTAPEHAIQVRLEDNRPQPSKDRNAGNGMTVSVGRIRKCMVLDYKMTILVHNTIRGAAGAAVLNAELLKEKNFI